MTFPRYALAAGLLAVALGASAQTAARKTYIVQLADAPAAAYTGSISGLPATRPAAGTKFNVNAPNVRAYRSYLDSRRNAVLAQLGASRVVYRYDVTFNGFAAQMTEAQAKRFKSVPGVVSITESEIRKLDTTRTPAFLGLSTPGGLWSQLDTQSRQVRGEDVIIGIIDSGVWPEDPSFGDKVDANSRPVSYFQAGTSVYGAPPARWNGVCQTGQGFTSAMCNNKLIGARWYSTGFTNGGGVPTSLEYLSPRDGDSHGTHTASTAGGNANVLATIGGAPAGTMSGIAPRARVAVYKVCWEATVSTATGCYTPDTLAAIEDAVSDGVDVINYSVSGSQISIVDPVELAYFNAAAAGVFVAASAGNAGPANTVAHVSPWLTTVGASTHDRQPVADVTLGSGSVFTGASVVSAPLPSAALVLSSDIPAAGATVADANLCFAGSLSAAAAGKIVVCDRGVNDRVAKSAEVLRVGGVGMVLINPTANNIVPDFHTVPSVHLQNTARTAVRAYAATAGATATIGSSYQQAGVVAPVMASFSSRGPNKSNGNILKPDITGPGVDIIAGAIAGLTQAQHDALVLGNFTPPANATSLQGTSMSSPHIAGAAALLKQLYPSWSPAAIKSAIMTSAGEVKLASGATDTDRWGYGAGHMNPNGSANPGLVYDAGTADYGRFMCGIGLTPPVAAGTCGTLGSIQPWNLNLASLTASEVPGSLTFTRRVTNVTGASATFVASSQLPGWTATVSPASLTLAPGASANYTVEVSRTTAALNTWAFGTVKWTDGVRTATSPLSVKGVAIAAPLQYDAVGTSPVTRSFQVTPGFSGAMRVAAVGLEPAIRNTGNVVQGARQCYNYTVPVGAQFARFQLFDADTQGGASTDLDLTVFNGPNGTGTSVGVSAGGTSDEVVTLMSPVPSVYSACIDGFSTPAAGAAYTISAWVVGPAVGTQSLQATGPRGVAAGTPVSVLLRWSVPAGNRYMGYLTYTDGNTLPVGSTFVFIDARQAQQVVTAAKR